MTILERFYQSKYVPSRTCVKVIISIMGGFSLLLSFISLFQVIISHAKLSDGMWYNDRHNKILLVVFLGEFFLHGVAGVCFILSAALQKKYFLTDRFFSIIAVVCYTIVLLKNLILLFGLLIFYVRMPYDEPVFVDSVEVPPYPYDDFDEPMPLIPEREEEPGEEYPKDYEEETEEEEEEEEETEESEEGEMDEEPFHQEEDYNYHPRPPFHERNPPYYHDYHRVRRRRHRRRHHHHDYYHERVMRFEDILNFIMLGVTLLFIPICFVSCLIVGVLNFVYTYPLPSDNQFSKTEEVEEEEEEVEILEGKEKESDEIDTDLGSSSVDLGSSTDIQASDTTSKGD